MTIAAADHQIAIADAGVELHLVAAQLLLRGGEQRTGFVGRDVSGRELAHHLIFDRDQIAAHGPIVRPQRDSLRRGFERRAAGEALQRVVAEQTEARDIRARRQRLRHMIGPPDDPAARDRIHRRHIRRLQRRPPAERLLRLIRRPIGNNKCVFHCGCFTLLWATLMRETASEPQRVVAETVSSFLVP